MNQCVICGEYRDTVVVDKDNLCRSCVLDFIEVCTANANFARKAGEEWEDSEQLLVKLQAALNA